MAIALKVARSPKEKDDALWVRHQVYVIEDGKFGGKPLRGERIVDRFDVIPEVAHLIAYDGDEPIATMRVNCDRGLGLPSEEHFDFGPWRHQIEQQATEAQNPTPIVTSGGMLAVREGWRSRRDVIRALYKIFASVMLSWNASHVIASVNHETVTIYRRFGFSPIGDKTWVEEIGNHIVPMAAKAEDCYAWAFQGFTGPAQTIFRDSFQRLLLRSGETLFHEGERGDRAFIIDSGNVRISRTCPDGPDLVLAVLGRGDLFGELALIDDLPRSATAEALGDVELISLDRESFERQSGMTSDRLRAMLSLFSARLRKTDELATVLAFESEDKRLQFALETLKAGARPDAKREGGLVAKAGAEELARVALVEEERARLYLERLQAAGEIELGRHSIRFQPNGQTETEAFPFPPPPPPHP